MTDTHGVGEAVDLCIGSRGSHYDLARVAKVVLQHRLQYKGNSVWESWSGGDPMSLVRAELCHAIRERAQHWHHVAEEAGTNFDLKIDAQLKSMRLMQISMRLGNDRFLKDVMKEARAFFVTDE